MDEDYTNKVVRIIFHVFSAFSYLFNIIVILNFISISIRRKFTTSSFMFCFQSITNIFTTIAMTLEAITTSGSGLLSSVIGVNVYNIFFQYWKLVVISTLFIGTVDIYLVVKLLEYNMSYKSRKTIHVILSINLFVSAIPSIVYTAYIFPNRHDLHGEFMIYHIVLAVLTFGMIVLMFGLLISAFITAREGINVVRSVRSANREEEADDEEEEGLEECDNDDDDRHDTEAQEMQDESVHERQDHLRTVIILALMWMFYTIAYIPDFVVELYGGRDHFYNLYYGFMALFFFSAVINPLLILSIKKDYRANLSLNCFRNNGGQNVELLQMTTH